MTGKKLIGMALVLAVLVVLAVVQKQGGRTKPAVTAESRATLFQGLDLNAVDGVEIAQGANSVSLVKRDGKWVNASLYDYPVDFAKLSSALRTAAEIKLGSPVRASNVDASEFGMDKAKTLVLKSGGKDAVKLEIGARREASEAAGWANQHFVRSEGADEVYLADYDFQPFVENAADWIDDEILNIRSADIVSVKAGDVDLKKDAGGWKLTDLDEEQEEFQPSEANKLRMALQYLNCTTIADPALSDADLGFTNAVVYTASTTNQTYTVTVGGEVDNGRYIRLEGDVPEKLSGWTFVVSNGDAGDFLIRRDTLVKEKTAPEEGGATP